LYKAAAVENPPGIKDNSGHENTQEVGVFLREQSLRPYTGRSSFLEILIAVSECMRYTSTVRSLGS
jgi:hypothetical protein